MNEQAIQEQYKHIVLLLEQQRLKEAQSQLEAYLWNGNLPMLRERLEQVQTSYDYMLRYMRMGAQDPERQRIYRQTITETWEIADQTRLALLDEISSHQYHALRRNRYLLPAGQDLAQCRKILESFPDELALCQLIPDSQKLNATLESHEKALYAMFTETWINNSWSTTEEEQAHAMLDSALLPANDLSLFTSAVTLSLLECFDARKCYWLLAAVQHESTLVCQRAWVGFALTMQVHPNRLPLYPGLVARLSLYNETEFFGDQLNRIYIELLRSQETEKIDKQMRDEIIPEMIKTVNTLRNRKFGIEENPEENDLNPDWGKAMENSGLENKLRQMNELQQEGADVYMSTFAQLKNHLFFNELHNWFYPFDRHHSCIVKVLGLNLAKEHTVLGYILQSGFFCNSDKYSLCFIMAQIPQSQRDMILSQMTSQDLNELLNEQNSPNSTIRMYAELPNVISTQYIHDLYRFFKLHRQKHEFHDIFKEEIALHRIPALKETLCKPEQLKEVADYHFQKGHPAEALELYEELIAANRADADIYQKTGYCLQKEKRYKAAINAYLKADLLKPDHLWTIRHLATCYRQTREFDTALEYYKKAEAIQPGNHSILFYTGSCLAELERHEEALQYFFKLDYLKSNDLNTWRAIGWCSFVCHKYEQAARYYKKILADHPLATDYLNAGHVELVMGNIDEATRHYSRAQQECGSHETFLELFAKDKAELLQQGVKEEDLPLVLDILEVEE